jgi:hypothetical protein
MRTTIILSGLTFLGYLVLSSAACGSSGGGGGGTTGASGSAGTGGSAGSGGASGSGTGGSKGAGTGGSKGAGTGGAKGTGTSGSAGAGGSAGSGGTSGTGAGGSAGTGGSRGSGGTSGTSDGGKDGGCAGTELTVINFDSWCTVTVGTTKLTSTPQTLCETGTSVDLSATANTPTFEIGTAPWHDATGGSGTITGETAKTTETLSGGKACVWVCCPFSGGSGCPSTNQCP